MGHNEVEMYLYDFTLEKIMQTTVGDKLQLAMQIFETAQKHMYALSEKNNSLETESIRIGTVLTFAVLKKVADGKLPGKFDSDDWKEIADSVSKYAILQDNQSYSIFVFSMYERYIRFSASLLEANVSNKNAEAVRKLADEIQTKTELLEKAQITEVQYIEDNLWISLEAMIKLIAAVSVEHIDGNRGEFARAITAYAFEYGRYMLVKREGELVNQFVQSQYVLNEELEQKYLSYLDALKQEMVCFHELINNAYTEDFRDKFLYSISIAKMAGVENDNILKTTEEIDSFFMD